MKEKFLINFYKDGAISSQQRFLGGWPGAERLAQQVVEKQKAKGITVNYDIVKL